jgi:hypothetical protein
MKYYFLLGALIMSASLNTFASYRQGDMDQDAIPDYLDTNNSDGPSGDRDNDGNPNKYDRIDNNRDYGDKDHDGTVNYQDRVDNRPNTARNIEILTRDHGDSDNDGIENYRDSYDNRIDATPDYPYYNNYYGNYRY